jgi:hypothetical protein
MIQLKKLPFRKVEGAVLIADEDLQKFLKGRDQEICTQMQNDEAA